MQRAAESPVLQAVKLDVAAEDGGVERPAEAEHRLILIPVAHLLGQDHLPGSVLGVGHGHLELLDAPGCKDFDTLCRVTHHVDSNLPLTSKQKFCLSIRPMFLNANFVLVSKGGLNQRDVSPCISSSSLTN